MLRVLSLDKGDVLMVEGDESDNIFYIRLGTFNVLIKKDGKSMTVATLQKGEFVGEMASIDKDLRSATVVAAEKAEVLVITPEEFQQELNGLEPWLQHYITVLIKRLKIKNEITS